ncbi:hypothetical protein [Sorangium sp. So ce233]|uniref:hypothetical protein n=1 Tax=Sorangium sp. So ce233 TaxID=3133290 RepID=UPI003F642480
MSCGPCAGTGFVNLEQAPADVVARAEASGEFKWAILEWLRKSSGHDVAVCGCCGDGDSDWHGEAGEHDEADFGPDGPYAYNGGLPECF